MAKSIVALPLTDEHYTALGKVTAMATFLEATIEVIIWLLLGVTASEGKFVTTRRGHDDKIDLLKALCRERVTVKDAPHKPAELIGNAKAALKDRHHLIHAMYDTDEQGILYSISYSVRDKATARVEPASPEAIRAIATKLENAACDLLDFYRLLDEKHPNGSQSPRS